MEPTTTEELKASIQRAVTPAGMKDNGQSEESSEVVVYKLRYPVELDGKRYTELRMDFANLNGGDVIECEHTFRIIFSGDSSTIPKMTSAYWWTVAARAAGVNHGLYLKLKMHDFDAITLSAMQAMGTPVSAQALTG